MLFQDIVVGVELIVFFLETLGFRLSLLPEAIVQIELLRHVLKLLLLNNTNILKVLQLARLHINRLLQVPEMERCLSFLLVEVHLGLTERTHILV